MKTISLNGIWQLSGKPQEQDVDKIMLSAEVPGCVQLDLSREGILPKDLFMGENILEAEKYEDWEWWYSHTFTAPEEREHVFLVFRGVDCLAEYFLNGEKLGESDNMLIPFEFEVGHLLRDGENELTVHITSAVIRAHETGYDLAQIDLNWRGDATEQAVRRAPHSYGWDIMPRAVTAGLWRDVQLELRDSVRLSQIFVDCSRKGQYTLCYEAESDWSAFHDMEIEVEGGCGDSTFHVRRKMPHKTGKLELSIENPKLWWPYGYGEANLYSLTVRLYRAGELIHEANTHFGIRTVELDRTDMTDGVNGRFRFLINGVEILCKGSNWVPLDAFHCRDRERYPEALALVKDIGCNILRCWGGNVYEDREFYDFCDENGIMIWQDFSMACGHYPQNEEFCKKLYIEAESVVRTLRHHPSVILWGGDNECDEMLFGMGARPSQNKLTREVLPDAVRRNDIGRPYMASSPFITDELLRMQGQDRSETHLWGPRDYYKSDYYKHSKAHFVSETGYHGCPSLESIKKFITPDKVWPYHNNSEWILHSSDQFGNDSRVMLMEKQVRQLFGEVPTDPEDYIFASQVSQAEAKKYFIERIRLGRPQKSGVIWWNLLDGWPQMSDAVVDYYFTKKLAYNYIKRAQAPFVLTADEISHWNLRLYACNDTLKEKSGTYRVTDADNGEVLSSGVFTAGVNGTFKLDEFPVFYSEQKMLLIEWEVNGEKGFNHYLCGYPAFSLEKYKSWVKKLGL
ncbi:MAG: hypothetical protein J6C51_00580 [Clostridia bacterium]|nr:hypothetical protein [Clostridia bacterium]